MAAHPAYKCMLTSTTSSSTEYERRVKWRRDCTCIPIQYMQSSANMSVDGRLFPIQIQAHPPMRQGYMNCSARYAQPLARKRRSCRRSSQTLRSSCRSSCNESSHKLYVPNAHRSYMAALIYCRSNNTWNSCSTEGTPYLTFPLYACSSSSTSGHLN